MLKNYIKNTIKEIEMAGRPFIERSVEPLETLLKNESVAQKTLMLQYKILAQMGVNHLPEIKDVGFRKYSQFEEDGILHYIFSLIPPENRTCVEICAGNGLECNTANLIINHGWWGHLFDGNIQNVRFGTSYFSKNKDTFIHPPRFTQAWITAENVNQLINNSGASGKIDLLSLDIDGMDYWIWKAIKVIEPILVVCEINNYIPHNRALTVPYKSNFVFESEVYRGASLAAMCNLGREKGYRLIGTHRFGFNAFFMKNGVGEKYFPEKNIESCLNDSFSRSNIQKEWENAKSYKWVEV